MYWLGERLLGSRLAAWMAGTLTATGQGFSFMVGTPVSTLLGFASVAMILAFVEWSGLLRPPFRWREWLHTGWLIAAVSLLYPVYLGLLAFLWLHGLRRAPFMRFAGPFRRDTGPSTSLAAHWRDGRGAGVRHDQQRPARGGAPLVVVGALARSA